MQQVFFWVFSFWLNRRGSGNCGNCQIAGAPIGCFIKRRFCAVWIGLRCRCLGGLGFNHYWCWRTNFFFRGIKELISAFNSANHDLWNFALWAKLFFLNTIVLTDTVCVVIWRIRMLVNRVSSQIYNFLHFSRRFCLFISSMAILMGCFVCLLGLSFIHLRRPLSLLLSFKLWCGYTFVFFEFGRHRGVLLSLNYLDIFKIELTRR